MKTTTEKGFRIKIREACKGVGSYREEFEELIGRLASLYVRANLARDRWRAEGSEFYVTQVNKGGNEYYIKHPLLTEIDNTEKNILMLEKELGLTPAAIKRINEAAIGKKKLPDDDPLVAALGQLRLLKTGTDQ